MTTMLGDAAETLDIAPVPMAAQLSGQAHHLTEMHAYLAQHHVNSWTETSPFDLCLIAILRAAVNEYFRTKRVCLSVTAADAWRNLEHILPEDSDMIEVYKLAFYRAWHQAARDYFASAAAA